MQASYDFGRQFLRKLTSIFVSGGQKANVGLSMAQKYVSAAYFVGFLPRYERNSQRQPTIAVYPAREKVAASRRPGASSVAASRRPGASSAVGFSQSPRRRRRGLPRSAHEKSRGLPRPYVQCAWQAPALAAVDAESGAVNSRKRRARRCKQSQKPSAPGSAFAN